METLTILEIHISAYLHGYDISTIAATPMTEIGQLCLTQPFL